MSEHETDTEEANDDYISKMIRKRILDNIEFNLSEKISMNYYGQERYWSNYTSDVKAGILSEIKSREAAEEANEIKEEPADFSYLYTQPEKPIVQQDPGMIKLYTYVCKTTVLTDEELSEIHQIIDNLTEEEILKKRSHPILHEAAQQTCSSSGGSFETGAFQAIWLHPRMRQYWDNPVYKDEYGETAIRRLGCELQYENNVGRDWILQNIEGAVPLYGKVMELSTEKPRPKSPYRHAHWSSSSSENDSSEDESEDDSPVEPVDLESIFKGWKTLIDSKKLTILITNSEVVDRIDKLAEVTAYNAYLPVLLKGFMWRANRGGKKNWDPEYITMFLNEMEEDKDLYQNQELKDLLLKERSLLLNQKEQISQKTLEDSEKPSEEIDVNSKFPVYPFQTAYYQTLQEQSIKEKEHILLEEQILQEQSIKEKEHILLEEQILQGPTTEGTSSWDQID